MIPATALGALQMASLAVGPDDFSDDLLLGLVYSADLIDALANSWTPAWPGRARALEWDGKGLAAVLSLRERQRRARQRAR